MKEKKYIEGFNMYATEKSIAQKQLNNKDFTGRELCFNFDESNKEYLYFKELNQVEYQGELWEYESMPVDETTSLITIHMLAKELPQYVIYVVDEASSLVTKADCTIHEIEQGSSPLSDTTNLVKREFSFGYLGDVNPVKRHHFTHDLCDWILETAGTPGSVIRYHIHSDTKLSYYQKEWPLGGNPTDKDGVGYGEAAFLKIAENIYVITFTKHSHGNQPFMLWNKNTGRYVANFSGVSRRNHNMFVMTGTGFLKRIHL